MQIDPSFIKAYFGDAVADSGILMLLMIIDITLALSYKLYNGKKFLSNKMLSGILRDVILSVVPLGVRGLSIIDPRTDDLYSFISAILFILIGYSLVVSIFAYTSMLGIKYPAWLLKFLDGEIAAKGGNISIEGVVNDGREQGERSTGQDDAGDSESKK